MRKVPPKAPPTWVSQDFRLSNDELAKAINVTMNNLKEHHIKYNPEVLKATEKHYIALVAEELRRSKID